MLWSPPRWPECEQSGGVSFDDTSLSDWTKQNAWAVTAGSPRTVSLAEREEMLQRATERQARAYSLLYRFLAEFPGASASECIK